MQKVEDAQNNSNNENKAAQNDSKHEIMDGGTGGAKISHQD